MNNQLTELKTIDDLDRLLASAPGRPVVLYKHSMTCGTSGMALEEIRNLLAGPAVGAPVGIVFVSRRALSRPKSRPASAPGTSRRRSSSCATAGWCGRPRISG